MKLSKFAGHFGRAGLLPVAALGLFAALSPQSGQATEAIFTSADWFERQVGAGVVWRNFEFENLFGVRQVVSYLEVDLDDPSVSVEMPYLNGSLQRTSVIVPNQFPAAIAAVNGTYFSTHEGFSGHNTYFRINGTEVPHNPRTKGLWGHHGGFAKSNDGDWEIIQIPSPSNEWSNNVTHPTIMGNGPLVVLNGAIATTQINSVGGTHCTGRHPRTAVGITGDNKLILLTVDGRTDRSTGVTCNELADILLWLDVEDALNLDGGGTTTMWVAGEPASGVVNYPSDGTGERTTANAIAIVSGAATPAQWDAQLVSMSYSATVSPEQSQAVTLVYKNMGTGTWTAADTRLVTARPTEGASSLAHASWLSPSQPVAMSPASVAPGQNATFSFTVTAPNSTTPTILTQYFMLTQSGEGRIGPNDGRARLRLTVIPETPTGDSFIVETRLGGQNYTWYSDHANFTDSTASTVLAGTTTNLGSRWTSSFFSNAAIGLRTAQWRPNFPNTGQYHVSVAWPNAGTNRRTPVGYYVDHADGRDTIMLDQTAPGNQWYPLGTFTFNAGQSDDGRVIVTNEYTDQSGNLWAGPVRFIFLPEESSVSDWLLF